MDITQLKNQLAPHSASLCQELFPDGKIESGHFKVGSLGGEQGRSLSVILHGDRAGTWTDFATAEHGDLLDLIVAAKNMSVKEAMTWSQRRFDIRNLSTKVIPVAEKKKFKTPKPPREINTEKLHAFLEDRGFKDVGELVFRHKIYATEDLYTKGIDLVFQFFDPEGKLIFLKHKPIDYEGDPGQCNQADLKPILYGWHTLPDNARTVWITEGELDAIAARELGLPALSLPSGANNMTWKEHELDNLGRFEDIVLATDQDDAGEKCAQFLREKLGKRCIRIQIASKDINDLLKLHGYDKARTILNQAYEEAKYQDPVQLRSIAEFRDVVGDYFDAESDIRKGSGFGFQKIDEEDIRIRPNEFWGVTGINGSGKSMFLGQVGWSLMNQGKKLLIASHEMSPDKTLGRMMQQGSGLKKPNEEYLDKMFDFLGTKLWLFVDEQGIRPEIDELLTCFEYAYRRYDVDVFVIDSMTNYLSHDDYKGQQTFIEKIVAFKMAFPVTVFLVTHSRKLENEARSPEKFDVKGSGAITDLADAFISVWKNKPKTDHLDECAIMQRLPDEKIARQWDLYFQCLKNRNGMWEGRVGFDFDPQSCQYLESRGSSPKPFIKPPPPKDHPIL